MEQYSYPTTLYQPLKIPDYSSFAERRRLSGPCLRRFFRIMQKWKIGTRDMRLLLGGVSIRRFRQLFAHSEGRILNSDQLMRVTAIIAIYESLHKLLPRRQADKWIRMPKSKWVYSDRTPLSDMIDDGILTLWELRQRLEKRHSINPQEHNHGTQPPQA